MAVAVHQFQTSHHGGGGPPDDRHDSAGLGGTAAAGDWIMLVATGVGGAWDEVPVIGDDVAGAVGWTLEFDQTLTGGEGLRITGWKKLSVGGETLVTADWSGPVNHGIVGAWIQTPTLPAFVFLSAGVPVLNGSNLEFTNTAPIPDDGAVYIGGVGWGNGGLTNANFVNPPPAEGGVSYLTGGDGTGGVQHYNDDEGTNLASDSLTYQYAPNDTARVIEYWWATAASDDPVTVDLAGEGRLLVDASAELTTSGGSTDLAGEGRLLIDGSAPLLALIAVLAATGRLLVDGEASLDVEGGDVTVTPGVARLVAGGRAPLSAPDPSPPIPTRAFSNVVGCGVYEVLAFTRGGGEVVGSIEFDNLAWARQLDATSAASLVIDGVSNLGALERCCDLLGSLNPWEHELAIYRQVPGSAQKQRVWMGPITRMRFPNESVVIEALDLSGWLQRRTLHANHNFVQVDLIEMWVAWVEDAMSVDNSPGLFPTVLALSGILADRLTTIVDHSYAADAIAEIATTGIDWTVVDRVMRAGPVLPQPDFAAIGSLPLLLDEAFRVAPEIIVDGMAGANCWYVNGGGVVSGVSIFGEYGPAFDATPDHVAQPAAPDYDAIEDQYGRVELVVSETRILDQPSIDKAAVTRYDLTKNPVPYITGGELLPTAPIPITQMIPGALLRVKLNRACKPIDAVMRIQSVSVTANADGSESVDVGLEPLGTVSNG